MSCGHFLPLGMDESKKLWLLTFKSIGPAPLLEEEDGENIFNSGHLAVVNSFSFFHPSDEIETAVGGCSVGTYCTYVIASHRNIL